MVTIVGILRASPLTGPRWINNGADSDPALPHAPKLPCDNGIRIGASLPEMGENDHIPRRSIDLPQCLAFILSFQDDSISYPWWGKMSFEAGLDRYLREHQGERVHIRQLTRRFNSLPDTIIRKLKLFNWRPCGGGYWYS